MISGPDEDLWVFCYGSLMWRPDFEFVSRHKALVRGYRRRLCIASHVYRGTPERPGLVLGLDEGGECEGVLFRVEARLRDVTLAYLRERELVSYVYLEKIVPAVLPDGPSHDAVTYVADRVHGQYAPPMPKPKLLEIIRGGRGISGENADYVLATYDHLAELGIEDDELSWLAAALRSP